jgi:hypothetical protein
VIGIQIRKCFEKLLQIFFFSNPFIRHVLDFFAPLDWAIRQPNGTHIFPSIVADWMFGHFVLDRFHVE